MRRDRLVDVHPILKFVTHRRACPQMILRASRMSSAFASYFISIMQKYAIQEGNSGVRRIKHKGNGKEDGLIMRIARDFLVFLQLV